VETNREKVAAPATSPRVLGPFLFKNMSGHGARRPKRIGRAVTVFVYVDTNKQAGDAEHVKVFATTDAAGTWFEENDP
jgi:hypothetical protein